MESESALECGLLTNVVRSLTSSASIDQRELERTRLEKGYKESGLVIDKLLVEHENDVSNCLDTFRKVSNNITTCRERIQNVKNSLHTCKTLLQCRRDDLKKLWTENVEQKAVSSLLDQIYEIKHLDQSVEQAVANNKYREAVQMLKKSDILLNGPLSNIVGLNQLRQNVADSSQLLFKQMCMYLEESLVVEPFERQIYELSKSLNENVASESELCNRLRAKYASAKSPQLQTDWKSDVLSEKFVTTIAEILEALIVFDQLEAAMDALFSRSSVVYNNCVNDTIAILLLTTGTSGTDADSTQFVQLMQTLITQVRSAYKRHEAVSHEISKVRSGDDINNQLINRFWTCIQEVLKSVVNVHLALDISNEEKAGDISTKQKMLFRFDNTTCVSVHSSTSNVQPLSAICQPDPYNIVAIFHLANRFCVEIESKPFISSPCPFNVHLHTVIMDRYFIEHVKRDMEKKTEVILRNSDVWSSSSELPNDGKGILNSCIKIFDLCRHVANLIKSMEIYTQRFASLWLLILEVYTRSASEVYAKITRNQSAFDGENYKEHSKISATWAVDEDISRFLKSLPSWTIFKCSVPSTPSAEMTTPTGLSLSISESEPEIKQRTERESEILIGNLGIEKQIRQEQLITDIEHIKSIACMHKSLQWFVGNMRELMANVSPQAKKHMQCRIQMQSAEGGEVSEEILNKALEDRLRSLEEMSETCLLMLHLELRVRCFYHLYPLARSKVSASQDEHDREVVEFRNDMEQLHRLLKDLLPNKVKYLFDGLGHLCASIFIHSSQHMTKLSENGRKRICRNIFTVQKYLSPLTGRTESELNRARTFYELLNKEPDQLLASIMEQGAKFSYLEYNYLLSLAVRSHHLLSSQPGALESKMTQLREILSQLAK